MANQIYDVARYKLLTAGLNWVTADLILCAWALTPDFVAADLTIGAIKGRGGEEVGFSDSIEGKTVSSTGYAQSYGVIIPPIDPGIEVTWFTLCLNNPSVHDQSQPLLFIDTAVYMPFTSNGLENLIQPDWLENRGWFRP